jgi:oligopeptide transport system ATP-binding protein
MSQENSASTILVANHLVKTYTQRSGRFGFGTSQIKALDDVSVQLRAGTTLAVVGESGSGKSTLARCLLQLQPFDSGEVLFQGVDLAKLPKDALRRTRQHLQMVFQDPFASLNPRMKVGEIIGEGLLIHQLGTAAQQKEKVLQMLLRVGLHQMRKSTRTSFQVVNASESALHARWCCNPRWWCAMSLYLRWTYRYRRKYYYC